MDRKRKGTKKTTQENSKSSEEQHVKSLSIPEALVVDWTTTDSLIQPKKVNIWTRLSSMKRIITDISRTLNIFKRVLSLVISDIPLSWSKSNQKLKNRMTDEEMEEERQVFNFLLFQTIGTHNEFYQYGVIMMNCVKEVWKINIQHLNSFSLCTDVWSVTKPAVHFQAVMLCFALLCFALLCFAFFPKSVYEFTSG